jgi:uncharacterized protein (DUF433 family)/predicted nuclease of predicted toxin-antitoxin system
MMDENRITIEPGKRSGQPCLRGLRITVWDVLSWLGAGMTESQILKDYPELEPSDFRAIFEYAARGPASGVVKMLLDENLSRRLLRSLVDLFPGSSHAKLEALHQVPDELVWDYAQSNGFCLVSADSDFYERAIALGPPAKLILLRGFKYPALEAEQLLRSHADRIAEFLDDAELAVLILRPD